MPKYRIEFEINADDQLDADWVASHMEGAFGVPTVTSRGVTKSDGPWVRLLSGQQQRSSGDYTLILDEVGQKKIQVIKEVRAIVPGLGLKEAKDLVDRVGNNVWDDAKQAYVPRAVPGTPTVVIDGVDASVAHEGVRLLEEAGAKAHFTVPLPTDEEIDAAAFALIDTHHQLGQLNPTGR